MAASAPTDLGNAATPEARPVDGQVACDWAVVGAGACGLLGFTRSDAALRGAEFLVSVLPATTVLTDLLDYARLKRLVRGAFVINVGRGETVVDAALPRLPDEGWLAGAAVDGFRTEPLPVGGPFWSHPRVHVTPHTAGLSTNAWAPRLVADNIARMRRGDPPFPIVDRERGY